MKLQDMFPFTETPSAFNGLFNKVGSDSFFINSLCVKSQDQKVTIGHTYIIFKTKIGEGIKVYAVELLAVHYIDGYVYLFVQDLLTQTQFKVNHFLDNGNAPCDWMLVDLNYYLEKVKTISL